LNAQCRPERNDTMIESIINDDDAFQEFHPLAAV